jgi:glutathione S-transferase
VVVYQVIGVLVGYVPSDKEKYNAGRKQLKDVSKTLDSHLKGKDFLVGNSVSIADISIGTLFFNAFRLVFDEKTRQSLPNLTKWFEKVSSLPAYFYHYGKIWYCQK